MLKHSVFKNTLWQILGKGVAIGCSFLITFLLTRLLGVAAYGDYIFVTTTVLLFFSLADLGVGAIAIREIAKDSTKKQVIFSNAFILKFFLSLLVFIVFNCLAFCLPQFANLLIPAFLASFSLFFLTIRTVADILFIAKLELGKKVFFEVLASILFLLFVLVFFWKGQKSLNLLIISWTTAAAVSGLLALLFVFRKEKLHWQGRFSGIKKLFCQAFPLGVRQLIFSTYDRGIDSFFLKTFLGSLSVAYYGLAYKVYGSLVLLAAFLMNSLFPILSKKQGQSLVETFKKAGKILFFSGLAITFFTFILSPFLIEVLGGSQFLSSVAILQILSFGLIIAFLNHLIGYTMIVIEEQKTLLYFSLVALLVNLIGNWLFVPRFGGMGAAGVTVATELTSLILGGLFVSRKLKKFKKQ